MTFDFENLKNFNFNVPFLCNYILRTILSALNAFSFGRRLVLYVTASDIYLLYCAYKIYYVNVLSASP